MADNTPVMRVILPGPDGKDHGYDLMRAFRDATMSDWKALIHGTGRGSGAVKAGIDAMSAFSDKAGPDGVMTAEIEERTIETLTDLIFLARRTSGERPLEWSTVADTLPYMATLEAMGRAAQAMEEAQAELDAAEVDPT